MAAQPAAVAAPSTASHFFFGALSATVSAVLLQPFDVVRSVQQAGGGAPSRAGGGAVATAARLAAAEGVPALWKGVQAAALRTAGGAGLYFSALSALRARAGGGGGGEDVRAAAVRDFVCGAAARALAAAVLLPVSVVKTRAELAPRGAAASRSPLHGLVAVARADGVRALLRGYLPTLLRDAPFSGLYLAAYSRLRVAAAGAAPGVAPAARDFGAALAAGALASLATQPADILKTRTQMARAAAAADVAPPRTLRGIVAAQGLRGLFIGAAARLAKRALSTAMTWSLYEEGLRRVGGGG